MRWCSYRPRLGRASRSPNSGSGVQGACMKRVTLICSLYTCATVVLLGVSSAGKAEDGAMFRGDLSHTGVYPGPALRTSPTLRWSYHTDGYVISSPAVTDEAVY